MQISTSVDYSMPTSTQPHTNFHRAWICKQCLVKGCCDKTMCDICMIVLQKTGKHSTQQLSAAEKVLLMADDKRKTRHNQRKLDMEKKAKTEQSRAAGDKNGCRHHNPEGYNPYDNVIYWKCHYRQKKQNNPSLVCCDCKKLILRDYTADYAELEGLAA